MKRSLTMKSGCTWPPRRTDPVTAVPFPNARLDDPTTCQGIELMRKGASLEEAALILDVDALILERAICDYRPPYQAWLQARATR
jgi:hypothetical protein